MMSRCSVQAVEGARRLSPLMAIVGCAFFVVGCATGTGARSVPRSAARAELEAAARATPGSVAVLRDLGWARYFDGDAAGAKKAFLETLAVDGDDGRARFGLATLADEGGRFREAREQLLRLLESAAVPVGRARNSDPFRAAVELSAVASLERLAGEAVGDQAVAARLAAIDLTRVDADLAQRILGLRAAAARRRGAEADAAALDAARGGPALVVTTTSYGHLPHLELDRRFAPETAAAWPAPLPLVAATVSGPGTGPENVAGPASFPPAPFQTALVATRGGSFAIETPQGQPGVAYARTFVRAERDVVARALISSDQSFHLIVDGVTVFRQNPESRYQTRLVAMDLPLAAGWHSVLLKIAAPGPRSSLALRLSATPALAFATDPPAAYLAGRPQPPRVASVHLRPRADLTSIPASAARAQPLLFDYLAGLVSLREGDPDAATEIAARLIAAAPKFVPGLTLAAQVADADVSRPHRLARDRARRHLERALALDPACLAARYELAEMDIQEDHPEKALTRLAEAPVERTPTALLEGAREGGAQQHHPEAQPQPLGALVASANAGPAAASAPAVDGWRLDFARYRALRARGWLVEAERALASARVENPDSCLPLQATLQLANDRRDAGRARALAKDLVACAPEAEELAVALREAGNAAGAAAEYRRLLLLDSTRSQHRSALGDALVAAGDVKGAVVALAELVSRQPRVVAYRRQLADALLAGGSDDKARLTLWGGLALAPESEDLHKALAALGEPGVMDSFRVDGKQVIAAFEASGVRYESPAVIVLDRTVTRVFSTGARMTLTHNIVRVQTKDGIDKWGEVQVPEGADVLLLRTVKADGTTREPEQIAEKQSTSVPDLAPGDYVEFEYLDPSGAPQAFPGGFYGERFFFQSFDAPLDRTEYVLASPRAMPVQIDRRGAAPEPVVTTREDFGGLDVRTWSDRKKPQLVAEPAQTPFTEEVPSVRAGSAVSFSGWRDYLDEQSFGARRSNGELRALAERLKTPQAIDEWVRHNIKQGGSLDDTGSAILARGDGSRVVLERALLSAAGIPSEIELARPRTAALLDGVLPDLEGYDEPVLAVGTKGSGSVGAATTNGARLVIDPRFRHAPTGFLAPLLRGVTALPIGRAETLEAPARMSTLPGSTAGDDPSSPTDKNANPDRRHIQLDATLQIDGGADVTVVETLRGWPALEWREGLDRINEDRVRAEFEQHTLGFYFPGASLTELRFEGKDRDAEPFIVTYKFHAPSFARVEGRVLLVPAPYPALLAKRYVGVAERRTQLQLLYAAPSELDAVLHLPAGARVTPAPPASATTVWGRFSQEARVDAAGALHFHAGFAMPPSRVSAADYQVFRRFADTVDRAEARAAKVELN